MSEVRGTFFVIRHILNRVLISDKEETYNELSIIAELVSSSCI